MTPEEFIKNHPFPPNGSAINDQLVKDIQDPSKIAFKQDNLNKLLENNARLIYMIYNQYNYNQSLGSIMSFVYEGLCKATETYDPSVGMPFYHYAVQTIRGLLQNWYNYNNDIIHVPVMKRRNVKYDYADINDYVEHQFAIDETDVEDDMESEFAMLLSEYRHKGVLTETAKQDLEVLELYRIYTIKEISDKLHINTVKVRKMIDRATNRLKSFHRKLQKELG